MDRIEEKGYWDNLRELIGAHRMVIDRPAGSAHPRFPAFHYPFDYGYLEGTTGGDGQGIDLWAGSGDRSELTGILCTVDLWKRDAEIKLLLGCTPPEVEIIRKVHNSGPQAAILVLRPSAF
jgi:inorganic pyrophosphatase